MNARLAMVSAALLAGIGAGAFASGAHDDRGWHAPQRPFRIYGNTYYVGSRGLSAILIAAPEGAILIDGTLPENAPMIEANIRALGFRITDVKWILNSHAHADHAGALAALARASGATVAASAAGARAITLGGNDPQDPQHGLAPTFPAVSRVRIVADDETVRVGALGVQAHYTPGHTPGSTSWTWTSCENNRCRSMVYADSLSLLSADGYRYSDKQHKPLLQGFEIALTMLAGLPCDILMAPHPESVGFVMRPVDAAEHAAPAASATPCANYAATGRRNLRTRLALEAADGTP